MYTQSLILCVILGICWGTLEHIPHYVMIFYHPKYKRRIWQWLGLKTTGFQMIRRQRIKKKKPLRTSRTEYRYLPLNEMDIFHLPSNTRIIDKFCKTNKWIIAPPLCFFSIYGNNASKIKMTWMKSGGNYREWSKKA